MLVGVLPVVGTVAGLMPFLATLKAYNLVHGRQCNLFPASFSGTLTLVTNLPLMLVHHRFQVVKS
jgi:hypothetical protein